MIVNTMRRIARVAHPSRVLATVSHRRELFCTRTYQTTLRILADISQIPDSKKTLFRRDAETSVRDARATQSSDGYER
jgi:hypothetical protein